MAFLRPDHRGYVIGGIGMGKGQARRKFRLATGYGAGSPHQVKIPLRNGTLQHTVTLVSTVPPPCSCSLPKEGTGIKAGGPMRAIFDALGVRNSWPRWRRFNQPGNVRATLDGLNKIYTPAQIAAKRGLTVEEILGADHE